MDICSASARALAAEVIGKAGRGNEDAGGAEEGLAGVAVGRVDGQGVAGDAGDVEVGDAVGVGEAGVAAVVGVAEPDEVGDQTLAVVDHGLGGIGAHVGRVGRAGARQGGAERDDGRSGLLGGGGN